jgi:peptidoglycan/xylan/chitin deacetylase (PgdA/CDA1 family)
MRARLNQIARVGYVKLWPWVGFFHKLLTRPEAGAFRILMLHDVPESQAASFQRLLEYLLENYGVLTPREVEARLTGDMVPLDRGRVPYLLTFDDGFKSNAAVAAEILDQLGVKAVFFVCPDFLDLPRENHERVMVENINKGKIDESLPEDRRFMSWDDCRWLAQAGHTIGAHSRSHRRLSSLADADRFREIVTSGEILASRLGVPVTWFAYPYGFIDCIDAPSLATIRRHYRFCCSGIRGLNSPQTSSLTLLREQLSLDMPFELQQLILTGAFDFLYFTRIKRLNKLMHGY